MLSVVAACSLTAAAFAPPTSALNLAPSAAVRMPVVEMNTRYTVDGNRPERIKKKNIDSNRLKGYTVGSRAPPGSVASGTIGAPKRAGGLLGGKTGVPGAAGTGSKSPAGAFGALVAAITLLAPFTDALTAAK